MNFLSRLAIPESTEHLALLKYLLVIVSIMFVTYSSIALIASTFSAFLNSLGRREESKGNAGHAASLLRFARDLADLAAPGKGVIASLGILPLITIILIYAQLFRGMDIGATTYAMIAALIYLAGYSSIYYYGKSFHFDSIFSAFQRLASSRPSDVSSEVAAEVENMERGAVATKRSAGRRGAVLLWLATWIFVGTTRLTFASHNWTDSSFLSMLFSGSTFLSLLNYTVSALLISSAAVLFFFFRFENGIAVDADDAYKSFVKKRVLPVGMVAVALEPLLILLEIQNLPQTGLSNATFAIAGGGMFVALIILIMFYSMLKDSGINLGSYTFVGVVLLVLAWSAKDEIALNYATAVQDQTLGVRYEAMLASLSPNTPAPVMSGEDIYNARCSACHRFDRKLVGPPYYMTLPHFVGKMDSLEDFINNPYQAVAGYPPMPNQGLKPQEVKNVANYIMGIYLAAAKKGEAKVVQ
jgi:cytochrome c